MTRSNRARILGNCNNRCLSKFNQSFIDISLTETGKSLEEVALKIPQVMDGCIKLDDDELVILKGLLYKALGRMS